MKVIIMIVTILNYYWLNICHHNYFLQMSIQRYSIIQFRYHILLFLFLFICSNLFIFLSLSFSILGQILTPTLIQHSIA